MCSKETMTHGGNRAAMTSVCCIRIFQLVATKHFPLHPTKTNRVMSSDLSVHSDTINRVNEQT